jgi:hypothetical protein
MAWKNLRLAVLAIAGALLGVLQPAAAEDRPFDRDWRTGVLVAPGAQTWTAGNLKEKQGLIRDVAGRRGKTCSHYAFLGWPEAAGAPADIRKQTRANYEAAGYTVAETTGDIPTDIVWSITGNGREATVLWGEFGGSTVYFSCITAGEPAADPDKPLYLTVLLALAALGTGFGLWLVHSVRKQGAASLAWPSTQGTVTSSEVVRYKTKGGPQFIAKIGFDYAVEGAKLAGNRLRFGNYAAAQAKAQEDAAKYPVGANVDVRYDPANPSSSVLEPGKGGVSVWGIVLAITGAILFVLALMVAFIN